MFNFEITPKITKEFLLSKHNQETYMSHYLGLPVRKGLFVSPLRTDHHKTCSFFKGKSGTLYFKDFATNQCLNFEGVVMAKYNCNYHEALKIIAKDFGFIKSNNVCFKVVPQEEFKEEKQTYIQVEVKDFSPAELKWWNSYGITPEILKKFNIFSCKTVFLNGSIFAQSAQHSPIYGYYFGKKENIEQWRIYFPRRQEFRFLGNCSTKILQGYKQLPKEGNLLVITKSMKDVAALYAYGISAIAPNSETQFTSDEVLAKLKERFKNIVVVYDNDLPGITNMCKLKKLHPELTYFFIPRSYGAKDFTDFRAKYGYEKTKKFIVKYLKLWQRSRQIQV
jgi:hypothetical protein